MTDRELSEEEIENLMTPSRGKHSYNIPGTNKHKKFDPDIRTVANWFKLPHIMNKPPEQTLSCQVPNHDEERQTRDSPRMFFELPDGTITCRWCFVESRDLGEH